MRDLFQGDDGGRLQDIGLLHRLVADQLRDRAEAIRAEGWKWIEVAPDFADGHTYGLNSFSAGADAAHRRGASQRATPFRPKRPGRP